LLRPRALRPALETGNPLIMDRALATPIGVMLGSASWYLFLTLSKNTMFRSLQKAALDWLNRLTGILLMALGASLPSSDVDSRERLAPSNEIALRLERRSHEHKEERTMGTTLFDGNPPP
jgi:hypothetical protein